MVEFWTDRDVASLRPRGTEDYKTHRRSIHGVQDVTLHNDLCNLSLFNKYAKKQGWTNVDLLEEVGIPSGDDAVRMHILNADEEDKYFALAAQRSRDLHDVGRLMLEQGCRPEEIRSLPQSAINLPARTFQILGGKTKAARRTLNLTTASVAILEKRITGEKWVFPSSRKPGRHVGTLQTIHDNICRDAGVSFVLYDLRHTFATRFAEENPDPYQLAAILGHSGLRCVMKYVHVQQEHMKRGMERFEAARNRKKLRVVGE
jgi:integrase